MDGAWKDNIPPLKAAKPLSSYKIKKAGLILYGWADEQVEGLGAKSRLHVLATCTEGRFGDRDKYYSPVKGSVDTDESSFKAALRETGEETGFYVEDFVGVDNYSKLLRGEALQNITNTRYHGVEIVNISPQPVADHVYMSPHGTENRTQYFAVEVKGIEHLRGHLKTLADDTDYRSATVRHTAEETRQAKGLPDLEAMLNIMRSGEIPEADHQRWEAQRDHALHPPSPDRHIIPSPVLPAFEKQWLTERGITERNRISADEWASFMQHPPEGSYKAILADMECIKHYFEAQGIIGDTMTWKLDLKDRPLMFYHEMAEILPIDYCLERVVACANKNDLYAQAALGEYRGEKRPNPTEAECHASAQFAPMISYLAPLAPMEIAHAAIAMPNDAEAAAIWETCREDAEFCPESHSRGLGLVTAHTESWERFVKGRDLKAAALSH